MSVDVSTRTLTYPENVKGRERNAFYDETHHENLVVFECVASLLDKGYRPDDIILEKEWQLGHESKSGRADICISSDKGVIAIIECKTCGPEYDAALKELSEDGGQLFSYWQQERGCQWLELYTSDFIGGKIVREGVSIRCSDDEDIIASSKRNESVRLYRDAGSANDLFEAWKNTYDKRLTGEIILIDSSAAYNIGIRPLRKRDLIDFSKDNKIVNEFEEILRHNNVSDKENAFNRLVALFICKLVDEIQKNDDDELDFQYRPGADSYEALQDRLQRLHKDGMEKFMREDIVYIPDSYAEDVVNMYTGTNREALITDLRHTLRILKFYSNSNSRYLGYVSLRYLIPQFCT